MKYVLFLSLLPFTLDSALAQFWNFPQDLNINNTSISFEVDSTWHLIEGKATDLRGKLWLEHPEDFKSVRGTVEVPVTNLITGRDSRDRKMHNVMDAGHYPSIKFLVKSYDPGECDPRTLRDGAKCESVINGELTINKITREVALKTCITKTGADYTVNGSTSFKWRDYDIDDPSILVAKLYEDVNIKIQLTLNSKK